MLIAITTQTAYTTKKIKAEGYDTELHMLVNQEEKFKGVINV